LIDEDIPQLKRDQLRAEAKEFIQDTFKELTRVGRMLPRLRGTSRTTNVPGVIETLKGAWSCSEEIGKQEPPNLLSPPARTKPSRAIPQASGVTQSKSREWSKPDQDETIQVKDSGTKETTKNSGSE
jgi:hypothetical protein